MKLLMQVVKLPSRAAVLMTSAETDAAEGVVGDRVVCGSLVGGGGEDSQHLPVGTWQRCSSPQRWQKVQDVLRLFGQTVSRWLWGFGERVKGSRRVRVGER